MEFQVAQSRIAIEVVRRELLKLGKDKPLTEPEVVNLSQKLDQLLNEYEYLKKQLYLMRTSSVTLHQLIC